MRTDEAPGGTGTRSHRSIPAACVTGMCGPPNGHPLPKVRSSRRPSSRAFSDVKRSTSRNSSERYRILWKPFRGRPAPSGRPACTSAPPMPPAFMARNSRSISALVTPGPNHHQRIMMRASSGGFSKDRRRVSMSASAAMARTAAAGSRMARRRRAVIMRILPSSHRARRRRRYHNTIA